MPRMIRSIEASAAEYARIIQGTRSAPISGFTVFENVTTGFPPGSLSVFNAFNHTLSISEAPGL